jgi:RHS repeat-associated protein
VLRQTSDCGWGDQVERSGVDEPVCLIEAAGGYAGTYYYHFDGLGSCVALTNGAGNVVELYEYCVYGQAAASDTNHPNRFLFTGREFDADTGLYYYRARYYHPEIGRFLQTDPIGYGDGMNQYAYCGNSSVNGTDPSGCVPIWYPRVVDKGTVWAFEFSFNSEVVADEIYSYAWPVPEKMCQ